MARALALLAIASLLTSCTRARAPHLAVQNPRLIVLVTIDTLRADRLGAYGSTAGLTPNLDRFAEHAVRFAGAVTQVPLTLPAHATILTGLHPARHGIRTNDGFQLADVHTLAEALQARGYATGAFIGGYPLRASSGLARGFDRYDDDFLKQSAIVERRADEVVTAVTAWVDAHRSQPVFVWLHLFDPHSPYTPPAPFATKYASSPYDGEIAYTDAALGRFFEQLERRGLLEAAATIVVADHGESLGEHGERTHGTFLYDATIHVPLLVKWPSAQSHVVDAPVETADLAPTIAAMAGASLPAVDGQSLLPLVGGAAGDPDRPAYAESYYQNVLLAGVRCGRSTADGSTSRRRVPSSTISKPIGRQQNRVRDRGARLHCARCPAGMASRRAPSAAAGGSGGCSGMRRVPPPTPASRSVDPKERVEVWANIGGSTVSQRSIGCSTSFAAALRLDPGTASRPNISPTSVFAPFGFAKRVRLSAAIAVGFVTRMRSSTWRPSPSARAVSTMHA
jgi:arylsulfatase A-like enzyme